MTYFTDSEELRQLGALFGITDPDAGHEAIGDEITAQFETLRNTLRMITELDGDQPARSAWNMVHLARAALAKCPPQAASQEDK